MRHQLNYRTLFHSEPIMSYSSYFKKINFEDIMYEKPIVRDENQYWLLFYALYWSERF